MNIESIYQIYKLHPNVQTDSRKLAAGDLFFALSGPNFDGNAFAAQALEKGAAYAVIDNPGYSQGDKTILVDNVLDCLQQLARHHRRQMDIPFIAITGSNGKTTTKELVAAVLKTRFRVYATEGNLNNHIGVPLTLLKVRDDAQMVIVEMGANHLHEIAGYCEVALPTHGIITNCGRAHLEGFGSPEGVRKAKGELYDYLRAAKGTVFLNTDLDYLAGMASGIDHIITYGHEKAQYTGHEQEGDLLLHVVLDTPEAAVFGTQLVGGYNFPNVMVAAAVGMHFGVDIKSVQAALQAYQPDNSRSQLLIRGNNRIILDAYNANPSSMREAIINFAQSSMDRKTLWLGGMKEMGAAEHDEHQELVRLIDQYQWEDVILVGREFEPMPGRYRYFETSAAALEYVKSHKPDGCSLLIKGSRGSKMELMLEAL